MLSSFDEPTQDDLPGTLIVSDEELEAKLKETKMERQLITGIAHDKNEAKIIVTRVPDKPGAVASIFTPLADAAINVDMIIQNDSKDTEETDVTFTVPRADLARSVDILEARKDEIGFRRIITDTEVAKISVGGVGMASTRPRLDRNAPLPFKGRVGIYGEPSEPASSRSMAGACGCIRTHPNPSLEREGLF